MALILYLIAVALYLIYKWSISTFDYFERQGIPFRKPIPLIGTNSNFITKKLSLSDSIMKGYNEFPNERASGLFGFRNPVVLIRDPKLAKQLAVKDFEYFTDHRVIITEDNDPMIGKALSSLKGQKWKDMRSTLSPAFTGSKMRQMFDFVSTVGQQTSEAMRDEIKSGGDSSLEFKALATKFTVDVIASCAFGIEVNSFKSPDNDFHRIANKVLNFQSPTAALKFSGFMMAPGIMKWLNIHILDKESCDFFQEAIHETMKIREEKGIIRHDMINLLIQARKGQLQHEKSDDKGSDGFATVQESEVGKAEVKTKFNDDDLAAQAFIFFLAGFDTVASTMSFMAYEVVANPEIQKKLFKEIQEVNNSLGGKKVTYEKIQGMKYLDQIVSETLRKWPVAPVTDRICVKEYDLKYDDKVLHFEKGVNFFIPIWAYHHDPQYFPNPEKFDPERFSDENRSKIDPDTYLPFGIGPRNCIGSRFALMELKTVFYYLLLNFSLEVTAKTQIPLKLEKIPMAVKPENGVWLALKPRDL